jgi:hypothetical protein
LIATVAIDEKNFLVLWYYFGQASNGIFKIKTWFINEGKFIVVYIEIMGSTM